MNKNYVTSPQIISTMEMNNEPWEITDSSSNFIYSNAAKEKGVIHGQ
ncbi:hypothetical protein [Photorhabdus laumondii]|nr:hypothetical protein [Photorhabdus laumondii]